MNDPVPVTLVTGWHGATTRRLTEGLVAALAPLEVAVHPHRRDHRRGRRSGGQRANPARSAGVARGGLLRSDRHRRPDRGERRPRADDNCPQSHGGSGSPGQRAGRRRGGSRRRVMASPPGAPGGVRSRRRRAHRGTTLAGGRPRDTAGGRGSVAFFVETSGWLDQSRLDRWIGDLLGSTDRRLLRIEGVLAIRGRNRQFVYQRLGNVLHQWRGRRFAPGEALTSRLAIAGRNLDAGALQDSLTDGVAR